MTAQTAATATAIDWLDWGPDAFERAAKEDKLILLDIGATWCHWCHVMDRETYEDPEVIALVSEKFIPVRIDRDRLPDVDHRMQRSQALISPMGQAGGWPLTVVLTPQDQVLFKATFLPPRASPRYGTTAGLIEMLQGVEQHWNDHRRELEEASEQLHDAMVKHYEQVYSRPGQVSDEQIERVVLGLRSAYDKDHGGFGRAPKFFTAVGLQLLLSRAWEGDDGQVREMAVHTLAAMAAGGVYDQLAGGFHRYSVDERWHVPHFEKMAYDNAALLRCYADAYALTGEERFAHVARETLAWIDTVLLDDERRGFYASQNADVGLEDDGDYFTWTEQEIRDVLGEQTELLLTHYGVDEIGDMRGRVGRNVLHVAKTAEQLTKLLDQPPMAIAGELRFSKAKLLSARRKRTAPSVDRTVFADLNGMLIDAYLTVYERLGEEETLQTALAVTDYLLNNLRDERGLFAHYRCDGSLRRVGLLGDQAWMTRALLHAYEVSSERRYLEAAETVAQFILSDLTAEDGGFLSGQPAAGAQPGRRKPTRSWEDSPSRSAVSVMAEALLDLGYLTGQARYSQAGAKALASFAGGIDAEHAAFLAGWALAADRLLHGPRSVLVVGDGEDETTRALLRTAREHYLPNAIVMHADPARTDQAALLAKFGFAGGPSPSATVCAGTICLRPARNVEELNQRFQQLRTLR